MLNFLEVTQLLKKKVSTKVNEYLINGNSGTFQITCTGDSCGFRGSNWVLSQKDESEYNLGYVSNLVPFFNTLIIKKLNENLHITRVAFDHLKIDKQHIGYRFGEHYCYVINFIFTINIRPMDIK